MEEFFKEQKELNRQQKIVIMLLCIIINITGAYIAKSAMLPLWLDVIGTCVAAYFTGPVGAILVGVTNNCLNGIYTFSTLVYMFTSMVVGLSFYYCVKKGYLESFTHALISSFLIGFISVVISMPISLYFYDGKNNNFWGESLFDMFSWYGMPKPLCTFFGHLVVDLVDKPVSVAVAFLLIKKLKRFLNKYREKLFKHLIIMLLGVSLLSVAMIHTTRMIREIYQQNEMDNRPDYLGENNRQEEIKREPERFENEKNHVSVKYLGNYVPTIYNSSNGLVSSEANCIVQTKDGYIWIGGYSGLTRYDGSKFEFIQRKGITSVTTMIVDSKGRLWIGTNDNGFARYENGEFTFFGKKEGLSVDSIRAFLETEDGEVYIGTTGGLYKISKEDKIVLVTDRFSYVTSLARDKNYVLGTNNEGCLFLLENSRVISSIGGMDGIHYNCVYTFGGSIYAGTVENKIENIKIEEDGYGHAYSLSAKKEIFTDELTNISCLYMDSEKRLWVAATNGVGYINEENEFWSRNYNDFDSSFSGITEDYEGNLWFSSSNYGVMKLSQNQFVDLFAVAEVKENVVNAVCEYQGKYWCGTATGILVIDKKSYQEKKIKKLSKLLDGCRVRSLYVDSKDNLWICTYGPGLICYDVNGKIWQYNQENAKTTGNRFRCIVESEDGTIVAGTSEGVNFIKDHKLVATLTKEDGLENQQILCLVNGNHGDIYAASDGAGIYRIENYKIKEHIGEEQGLPAQVVLRMVPYQNGFFVICSNSLCYMEGSKVEPLESFPYYNNYDLLLYKGNAYVLTSAGMYVVDAEDLRKEKEQLHYRVYNYNDGLRSALVANSWNYVKEDGKLWFCTNKGVCTYDTQNEVIDTIDYKLSITNVTCDDKAVIHKDNIFYIPAEGKNIKIDASLRNFTLSNMKMRFYIEGIDAEYKSMNQWELESKHITNLKHGDYKIVLQVLSSDEGTVLKEVDYCLKKEAHVWEKGWYYVYLVIVMVWVISFLIWTFTTFANIQKRKIEIVELRQQAKSDFLAQMSHEIRTPVNAVIGMNEMILRESTEDAILEYAENVDNASRMLLGLVNDILDFSAIEVGKLQFQVSPYRLDIMVNDLLLMLKSRADKKGLQVSVELDNTLPADLKGDELRMKQVITNLLTNAVKYTQQGMVTMKVSGKYTEEQFLLCVAVADTGMGIKKEDMEKLFESFQRLDGQKNHTVEGAGLGLNITKQLVTLMNGRIYVESEYGEGSVFTVEIPQEIVGERRLSDLKEEKTQAVRKKGREQSFTAPEAKILVVDDNEMNLKVMTSLLKNTKIQVSAVLSGIEAIELCNKECYHLIFMDHMMPEMDGVETLHHIKEESIVNKETPIVILTANAVAGVKEEYEKEGFVAYLSKPVNSERLTQILIQYLPDELILSPEEKTKEIDETIKADVSNGETLIETETTGAENALINTNLGIGYCAEDEEIYHEIVKTYIEQSQKYLPKLEEYLEQEDWKNYQIIVHAIKSTSLNIGAKDFSELAKKLEREANQGNGTYVKEQHGEFIAIYNEVLENAKKI